MSHDTCLMKSDWLPISYFYKKCVLFLLHKVYYGTTTQSIRELFSKRVSSRSSRVPNQFKLVGLVFCFGPFILEGGINDIILTLMFLNSSINPILSCWKIRAISQEHSSTLLLLFIRLELCIFLVRKINPLIPNINMCILLTVLKYSICYM